MPLNKETKPNTTFLGLYEMTWPEILIIDPSSTQLLIQYEIFSPNIAICKTSENICHAHSKEKSFISEITIFISACNF